jgi:glucose-6-phosphate 1-dehydrogenase
MTIALGALIKAPGEEIASVPVELVATHKPTAEDMDAYERLLGEAMKGDATQFAREDYVEQAWRIVEPVLETATPVYEYEPNTWGPPQAERIAADDGGWHNPVVT